MTDKGGGAAPRKGMEYQNAATAYYTLTDKPNFLSEENRPTVFRIEQREADFMFTIRGDDFDNEHYFEAKYRSGEIKWRYFKNEILSNYADIFSNHADTDNNVWIRLITNASLNKRLKSFFRDVKKLRKGILSWRKFDKRWQERNQSVFAANTHLSSEDEFYRFAVCLAVHRHSLDELQDSVESYVRDCSPGDYKIPTKIILREIDKKDYGVIRREDIEEAAEVRLKKRNSTTTSETVRELRTGINTIIEDYEDASADVEETFQKEETVQEVGDYFENEDKLDNTVENQVTSITEDIEGIREAKETIAQRKRSATERSKMLRERLPNDDSTDSDE